MSTANPRMAGLAPDEVECLHAAARAIRNRTPAQAQGLLRAWCVRPSGRPRFYRNLAQLRQNLQSPDLKHFKSTLCLKPNHPSIANRLCG